MSLDFYVEDQVCDKRIHWGSVRLLRASMSWYRGAGVSGMDDRVPVARPESGGNAFEIREHGCGSRPLLGDRADTL